MAEKSNAGLKVMATGILVGIAAAALGGYTMYSGKVADVDTTIRGSGSNASLTEEAQKIKQLLKRDLSVADVAPEGATINGQPRLMPLFYAPELWQVMLHNKGQVDIVDIYDPAAPCIQGDIPNSWFIANNVSEALGLVNGYRLDSDSDGFTNEEEYLAKTCPSAANDYPDLVSKNSTPRMQVLAVKKSSALITTDNMFADASQKPESVNIRIYDNRAAYMPKHKATVRVGESFDLTAAPDPKKKQNRFTVVRFDTKEFPDYAGTMKKENVVVIRDNVTASSNKEFVLRAGKTPAGHKDLKSDIVKGQEINDVSVIMQVTAGSSHNKPGGKFEVPLFGSIKVPGGKADGSELRVTLQHVNDDDSVVIAMDGVDNIPPVPKAGGKASSGKKNRKK